MNEILQQLGGSQLVDGISKQVGVSQGQASSVISMALPLLMGAMQKNSQSEQGAQGLLGALQSDKHDGSLLGNVASALSNSGLASQGQGILGHLLGSNENSIAQAISQKTGVSASSATQILKMLAPILMSFLGKKVTDSGVDSTSGLTSMLSGVLGGQNAGNLLTSLLDSNGDGSVLDDVAGMFTGGGDSKKNPLGGLLGGLFGGK